jgi:hypothetical protein
MAFAEKEDSGDCRYFLDHSVEGADDAGFSKMKQRSHE